MSETQFTEIKLSDITASDPIIKTVVKEIPVETKTY